MIGELKATQAGNKEMSLALLLLSPSQGKNNDSSDEDGGMRRRQKRERRRRMEGEGKERQEKWQRQAAGRKPHQSGKVLHQTSTVFRSKWSTFQHTPWMIITSFTYHPALDLATSASSLPPNNTRQ